MTHNHWFHPALSKYVRRLGYDDITVMSPQAAYIQIRDGDAKRMFVFL